MEVPVPVPVFESVSSLAHTISPAPGSVTVTANAMHLALQKLELVQEEVHNLIQVCTNLAQEV